MPLVDIKASTRVDIGDDWYVLRNELGFYTETIMLVNAVDPEELKSFKLINEDEDKSNGVIRSKRTPGEIIAQRNVVKVQAYLIKWSHSDALTLENIQRIPTADSKIIQEKIEELEESSSKPFQDKNTDIIPE